MALLCAAHSPLAGFCTLQVCLCWDGQVHAVIVAGSACCSYGRVCAAGGLSLGGQIGALTDMSDMADHCNGSLRCSRQVDSLASSRLATTLAAPAQRTCPPRTCIPKAAAARFLLSLSNHAMAMLQGPCLALPICIHACIEAYRNAWVCQLGKTCQITQLHG